MTNINFFDQIKNIQRPQYARDFRFSALALTVYVAFVAAGAVWQLTTTPPINLWHIVEFVGSALAGGLVLFALSTWGVLIGLLVLYWAGIIAVFGTSFYPLAVSETAALLVSPMLQIARHWEKAVILRFGRFRGLRGPGVFWILPIADYVTRFVDTRIRATDFSAENTITKDTVPVYVDAIAFWMVWDPQKAVLEVENYIEAIVLSAQTALRDAIGKNELSSLLEERERLGDEIRRIVDTKTSPWGITILSVEIRDIVLPKELENAMSRRAQAERERQSRVILGTAEIEISEKFVEAANNYRDDPTALHLRAMNMIYEGIRQNGTIVLLPSSALSGMSLGTMLDDLAKGKLPDVGSAGAGARPPDGSSSPSKRPEQADQSGSTEQRKG